MEVKTFKQACKVRGYDAATILPDVSNFPKQHQKAIVAYAMLLIIAEALNDGHKFDWNNRSEYKWFPWFDMEKDDNNPSGFRFFDSYCGLSATFAAGGSRLCYRTEALAKYAGTTFIRLYKDMMVIPK